MSVVTQTAPVQIISQALMASGPTFTHLRVNPDLTGHSALSDMLVGPFSGDKYFGFANAKS